MNSIDRFFRIKRKDIVFMKFILEAYEGMSTLSTVTSKFGKDESIVKLTIPDPFNRDISELISSLREEFEVNEVRPV